MANYKSNRDYKSKEELLELISLKIVEEDGKFYLMDFDETFKQRIYSKSFTNIKRGLDNLKKNKLYYNSVKSKLFDKVIYNLQHKKCGWCGKSFLPKNNADKYCSSVCKNYAKIDQDRENKRRQRKNPDYHEKRIGTIKFGTHRNENFEKESKIVRNELKRTLYNY